jgi:hypothetical protein
MRHPIVSFLLVPILACGGISEGQTPDLTPPASTPPSADLSAACRAFFKGTQALAQRCGAPTRPELVEEAYVLSCVALASLPGSSVTVATLDASTAMMAGQVGCGEPSGLSHQGVVMPASSGTLPLGASCQSGMQCASGSCSKQVSGAAGCGVCQQIHALGESCAPPVHACDKATVCREGVCVWPGPELGSSCVNYGAEPCGPGFNCISPPDSILDGVCELRPGLGQPCNAAEQIDCQHGLACIQGLCVQRQPDGASCSEHLSCQNYCHDGVCQSPLPNAQQGEDCSFHSCAPGLFCSEMEVCQAVGVASAGDVCGYQVRCSEGLLCSRGYLQGDPKDRCVPEPGPGQPCQDLQCDSMSHCTQSNLAAGQPGTCAALGLLGQACPCISELTCDNQICRPFGTLSCP